MVVVVESAPLKVTDGVDCTVVSLDTGDMKDRMLYICRLDYVSGKQHIECLACDGLAGDIIGKCN